MAILPNSYSCERHALTDSELQDYGNWLYAARAFAEAAMGRLLGEALIMDYPQTLLFHWNEGARPADAVNSLRSHKRVG